MIKEEYMDNMVHHYSDAGFRIRQVETGYTYYDTWDDLPCEFTYEETDIPIFDPEPLPEPDPEPDPEAITDKQALDIILGVSE